MTAPRSQTTLARATSVTGRGYWSGAEVRVEFRPAAVDTGIVFVRDDLGRDCRLPLDASLQRPTPRRTVLETAAARVEMIEHVAAALAGLGVDNCEVGVTAAEMPGVDGSAAPFVEAIDDAGLVRQEAAIDPLVVTQPVRCEQGDKWIEARPPTGGVLSIEYNLDFGPAASIPPQWLVLEVDPLAFRTELAAARTFVTKTEADAILASGAATHVTPRDLLIFDDQGDGQPIDNQLRYPDECVRHKMLDVVGDLALAGRPVVGRIVACRSGHQLNAELVRKLLAAHGGAQPARRSA